MDHIDIRLRWVLKRFRVEFLAKGTRLELGVMEGQGYKLD